MGEPTLKLRHNQLRYSIMTATGHVLGATMNGVVAFAMFRAASEEHEGEGLSLWSGDEVLAETA